MTEIAEKIERIEKKRYYTSNIPDTYIKDAITGNILPIKVGSYDSLRLFKYVDATGTCNSDGRPHSVLDKNISRDPNICYYSCPEECMKHRKIEFDSKRVEAWYNFQEIVFPNGEFSIEEYKNYKKNKIKY